MSKPFYCAAILILFYLASCSSQNMQEANRPVYQKRYEGERTTVVLKMYADTITSAEALDSLYYNVFMGAIPLYLPDTAFIYKKLSQPTPFSPKSWVFFALDKPDYITLNLKDSAINSLKYLILRDSLQEGLYALSFENFNFKSGPYAVEFHSKDTITSRKIMLIK